MIEQKQREDRYKSCEAYIMQELKKAHETVNRLAKELSDLRKKAANGDLGSELDPAAYCIRRPITCVRGKTAPSWVLSDTGDDGFNMTSDELRKKMLEPGGLEALANTKISKRYYDDSRAMHIDTEVFQFSVERDGETYLLKFTDNKDAYVHRLRDIKDGYKDSLYYPEEQKNQVEVAAMQYFTGELESAIRVLEQEERKNEQEKEESC